VGEDALRREELLLEFELWFDMEEDFLAEVGVYSSLILDFKGSCVSLRWVSLRGRWKLSTFPLSILSGGGGGALDEPIVNLLDVDVVLKWGCFGVNCEELLYPSYCSTVVRRIGKDRERPGKVGRCK
jgi:hypothetical protein